MSRHAHAPSDNTTGVEAQSVKLLVEKYGRPERLKVKRTVHEYQCCLGFQNFTLPAYPVIST